MTLRFFLLNVITLQFAIVNCGYLEIELVNELFENYNKNTRPVYNVSLVLVTGVTILPPHFEGVPGSKRNSGPDHTRTD